MAGRTRDVGFDGSDETRFAELAENYAPELGEESLWLAFEERAGWLLADAEEADIGVYGYIVTPLQMLDYSFDERGDLNWILIEECYRDDSDPFGDDAGVQVRWRLWTKTEWILFEEKIT